MNQSLMQVNSNKPLSKASSSTKVNRPLDQKPEQKIVVTKQLSSSEKHTQEA